MLLRHFLGEKFGCFQKEFRVTKLKTGKLWVWGGEVLSEHRDDLTLSLKGFIK